MVVSTAAFHARVRGSVPGLGGLKETKMSLPHLRVKLSIVGSLRDRVVACSASDRQGSNFESCVWRTVSSHSSHHPEEVLLAQFSLYVHKGGLKSDSFHFIFISLVILGAVAANTKNRSNAVLRLGHRLRRWPNINAALGGCTVFAVWSLHAGQCTQQTREVNPMLFRCRHIVCKAGQH